MRHWHAAGARPSRLVRAQLPVRLPSSRRLFARPAASTFRHTRCLLDHGPRPPPTAFRPVDPVADPVRPQDVATTHASPAAAAAVSGSPAQDAAAAATSADRIRSHTARSRMARKNARDRKKQAEESAAAGPATSDAAQSNVPPEDAGPSSTTPPRKNKGKDDRRQRTKRPPKPPTRKQPSDGLVRKQFSGSLVRRTMVDVKQLDPAHPPSRLLASDGDAGDVGRGETFSPLEAKAYSAGGSEGRSLMEAMLAKRPSPTRPPLPNKKPRYVSAQKEKPESKLEAHERLRPVKGGSINTIEASTLDMTALEVKQPPVPHLFHGLDRVLFNQGVYQLQDPHSMVYNFDPYLQKIMPITEFDFNALKEYKTSSQDTALSDIATEHGKKYVGSTSSMTGTLAHFHYLLSNWRKINIKMLSKEFPDQLDSFTELNRSPTAIFLRWKDGTYAIDADKQYDGANVLMLLGKSLEKLLTMPVPEFERYRRGNSDTITHEERNQPESYHYSTQGDFLMRSQLDAYDPRLPGTGMFDLKTRAVVSIRMRASEHEEMSGYEIHKQLGQYESFEREYYDMLRSTTLKYSLQARMGRMDGIFVAYHNVKRIFGFQYLSLNEMDRALHGQYDRCLGNQEFSLSVELLNKILDRATEKFPQQSLRFHFETRAAVKLPFMYVFAEPMAEDEIDQIQNSQKGKVAEFERSVMGLDPKSEETEAEKSDDAGEDVVSQADVRQEQVVESAKTSDAAAAAAAGESGVDEADSESAATSDANKTDETTSVSAASQSASQSAPQDSTFLSLLSGSDDKDKLEQSLKPLLAMVLTVRSRVNGEVVERPEELTPEDRWDLEYTLDEIPSLERAWSLYEATKARRGKSYDRINGVPSPDDSITDDGKPAKDDYYIRLLKQYSQKGRKLRSEIDLAELDREQVVVGEPFGAQQQEERPSQVDTSEVVNIEGAEDYMSWLYGDKEV